MKAKNTNKADVAPAHVGDIVTAGDEKLNAQDTAAFAAMVKHAVKQQLPAQSGQHEPLSTNPWGKHLDVHEKYEKHWRTPAQSAQHTPGPLMVAEAKGTLCAFRIVEANERQRTVAFVAHSGSNSQDRANSDLFAAAPELLDALKAVSRLDYLNEHNVLANQVRSAIDKAEGK